MAVLNLRLGVLSLVRGDIRLLFITRCLRLLAYGSTGVILAIYFQSAGLTDPQIGTIMTGTLLGDAAISLAITLWADGIGRQRMLVLGCALKLLGGAVFAYNKGPQFWLLLFAATIGVISPSGNEVGPFMAVEQSILSDEIPGSQRTNMFAWYNLLGYLSTAIGSVVAGSVCALLVDQFQWVSMDAYRVVFATYGGIAVLCGLVVLGLSRESETLSWREHHTARMDNRRKRAYGGSDTEATQPLLTPGAAPPAPLTSPGSGGRPQKRLLGLSAGSFKVVAPLSLLFSLDAFAGGLVTGSLTAYYFHRRFNVPDSYLGGLLFGANVIAGFSSLAAGWVASKIGLINTMVFTHLPSNILLALIPLMPNVHLASALLFARYSISQMDVAPRQSFVTGIVPPSERTATIGITNIVRSLGGALGPLVTGYLSANDRWEVAFFLAGGLKVVYDLLLLTWAHCSGSMVADHEKPLPAPVHVHVHGGAQTPAAAGPSPPPPLPASQ